MATIYPNNTIEFRTNGEAYFFKNILKRLPLGWHIFYEPVICGRTPDFIIFNKNFGIIIFEVKDFTKDSITSMDPYQWELTINGQTTTIKSPLKQCMEYRDFLHNQLVKIKELRSDRNYLNRLKLPIYHMCVFTNITKEDANFINLEALIPKDFQLLKTDIKNINLFMKKLEKLKDHLFEPHNLSNLEEKQVIKTIFPEFRSSGNRIKETKDLPIKYFQFDNYLEEIHETIDQITHFINTQNLLPENFCIIHNNNTNYLHNLYDYIKFKNIPYGPLQNNGIFLLDYTEINDLEHLMGTIKYIYFMDINNTPYDLLTNLVNPFISRFHIYLKIELYANKPFNFNKLINLITSNP